MMLPSKAQSVRAERTFIPSAAFSFALLVSPNPFPMDFRASRICFVFLTRLGIIRRTITRSKEMAGMRLPNRHMNLSLVSTTL